MSTPEAPVASDLETKKGQDLVFAAKLGELDDVRELISSGLPVGFRDGSGWTSLMWASSEGHVEVVALLLDSGAGDLEADDVEPGQSTSLHWAAYHGHVRIIWNLLTHSKLQPSAMDSEGNTPLHLAAAGSHLLAVKTFLSEGVDVHQKNAYGNTALQLTTDPGCQALLKQAQAHDGEIFLCSCSGEFVSAKDSVAQRVIDSVSTPSLRPVRYANDCAAKIKAAEEALTRTMKMTDTEALEAAINAAKEIGASQPLIDDGVVGLERLRAQIALQGAVAEINGQRPLKERQLLRPLLGPLKMAREKGVERSLIEDADRLCQTVDAEASLVDQHAISENLLMTDDPSPEPPSAESDFSLKAEAGIAKLAACIAAAQAVDAMDEVVQAAEQIHRRLVAESELRKALLEAKLETAEDGTVTWVHHNGQRTASNLENLQLRNDWLDAAMEKCASEGVLPTIIEEAGKKQKILKGDLKVAVAEDEERRAKEAAAAAKAAKKKKGGKKK